MNWIEFSFSILIFIVGSFATLPQIFNYCYYKKTRGISFFSILLLYLLYSVRSSFSIYLLYPEYNQCIYIWNIDCYYYMMLTFNNVFLSAMFIIQIILFFWFYEKERTNILRVKELPVRKRCSYLFLYIPIFLLSLIFNFVLFLFFILGYKSSIIFDIQDIIIRILILVQGMPQLCHSLYYRFIGNVSMVSFLFLSFVSLLKTLFFGLYDKENQLWIYYLVSFFVQFPTFIFLLLIHVNYIKGNDPEVDFYLLSRYNSV